MSSLVPWRRAQTWGGHSPGCVSASLDNGSRQKRKRQEASIDTRRSPSTHAALPRFDAVIWGASGGSGAPLARPPTAPRRGRDHVVHLLERRNNSRVRPAIDGGTIPDDRQRQRGSAAATNDTVNDGSGSDGNGGGGGGRQRQHQHPPQRTAALTGRAVKHPLDRHRRHRSRGGRVAVAATAAQARARGGTRTGIAPTIPPLPSGTPRTAACAAAASVASSPLAALSPWDAPTLASAQCHTAAPPPRHEDEQLGGYKRPRRGAVRQPRDRP